jgi:hypothetical protein
MNALALYQAALDAVSDAVLAGDFAAYAAMIDLPYLVRTETARLVVTAQADLRPTFDALHGGLRARGVQHYKRLAREAVFARAGRIRREARAPAAPSATGAGGFPRRGIRS